MLVMLDKIQERFSNFDTDLYTLLTEKKIYNIPVSRYEWKKL